MRYTILYFGVYSHANPRNAVIIKKLRKDGHKVIECRSFSYLQLVRCWFRVRNAFDLMIVGFPGQKVMFLARLLTSKPIWFDAFTSHYGGYILDRQRASKKSFRALWYRFLDRWSCRLADVVLLDTNTHIDFFVREFGLPRAKFRRVLVGTDTSVFYPRKKTSDSFLVHFHGTGIPLQGIDVIRQAEKILSKVPFQIIVGSDSVPYDKLPEYIARADVCLGIFGSSEKTQLVIPNKIYEYAAMKKPIITLDTPAIRELFDERSMMLISRPDPQLIADAILRLRDNPNLSAQLGERAYRIVINACNENIF